MRICLPTVGKKGMEEMVHNHFGSAQFFTIYDTVSKNIEIVENGNDHHEHGSCQPVGMLSGHKVDAVMTSGMGKRAVQLLNESGVKVFLLNGNTVQEAVKKFESDELVELTQQNACRGHGCH